jgi:phage replication initiation protein
LFVEQKSPVLAARDKEDEEATTKTTRSARAKNPRLPHQKHEGDTSLSPVNNMGETADSGLEKSRDLAKFQQVELVMSSGEVKIVPLRILAIGECAVIDWVNLTFHEDTLCKTANKQFISDNEFILEASRLCENIFGFGITGDNQKIMNFYKNSWVLGDKFGFVCFGGQRRTMMFVLNGTGCLNAKMGWERRLNIFLNTVAVRPTLTRVDLAHDDFEGKYITVDWAEAQWHERTLSCGARDPNIERRGNWHRPSGKGRTLYIGCRDSGKFTRFYEKGKKEGDKESSWCRAEVELKSSDRVIPFDILLTPSDYFLGAYPCFAFLKTELTTPQRIKVKEKEAKIAYHRSIEIVKNQAGKYITFLRRFFQDDDLLLSKISHSDPTVVPKRLENPLKSIETCTQFLHDFPYLKLSPEVVLAKPLFGLDWVIEKGKPTLKGEQWAMA